MKQKILQNFDLKILAVLLSIVVWIIVVNIDDPVKSKQFDDVPIQFTNGDVLTRRNEVYEVVDGTENVDVVVTGRRSVIEDLSKENIVVMADLEKMNEQGVVPLRVTANKHTNDVDNMKSVFENVQVNVETLKKIQKVIKIETIGKPAENYVIGDYVLNLNQVYIEGPQSIVDSINAAKVQIDVNGASDNMSASAPILLYDASGELVDTSRLKLNIDTISINQEILYTKTVSVTCAPSGTPAEGYRTTGRVEISPSEVVIAGKKAAVETVNQITIPSSAVNITDQKSTYKTSIALNDYLPNGIEVEDNEFKGNINVIVYIEKEVDGVVTIPLSKLNIVNLPNGFSAEIMDNNDAINNNKIDIGVVGLEEDIDSLSASNVTISVDVEDYLKNNNLSVLREGIINIPLKISLPSGVRSKEEIMLRIKISTT